MNGPTFDEAVAAIHRRRLVDRLRWLAAAATIPAGLAASYGLARAGEPSSVWLWSLLL
jgi:hypothetical protein